MENPTLQFVYFVFRLVLSVRFVLFCTIAKYIRIIFLTKVTISTVPEISKISEIAWKRYNNGKRGPFKPNWEIEENMKYI